MNIHTSRARLAARRDYFAFVEYSHKNELAAWIDHMTGRGLAVNTIRQRVCLVRNSLNKQDPVTLPARQNKREGKWLDPQQLQGLLAAIPRNDRGRRDFPLITGFLLTGLRQGKVRHWRWDDFKNARTGPIPAGAQDLFRSVLNPCGESHHATMSLPFSSHEGEFIFIAARPQRQTSMKRQPLSPQEINRRIQRYARLAGLETQGINAECLRRTLKELGESVIINLVQNSLLERKESPVRWKKVDRDNRLHGIGRRGYRR